MGPERYEQLSRLFAAACDLPPDERAAFVQEQCAGDEELRGRLLAMLASDTDATPFLEVAEQRPIGSAAAGDRIGRFRIVGVLATGGMGVVYEAEQDHPRRRVALKVMRAAVMSPSAARRFRVEAELLGRLDHPGVARVYDAGVHRMISPGGIEEEIPYFAMELVAGEPVTAAARRLPLAERLQLMARICDAVHHAHQRGVIHRDLKPANILVTADGDPKILDFGVARATDARSATLRTHAGQLIGTLAYMSPEQVAGDPGEIDARTDVYALGAILYEMLAQRPVHDLRDVPVPEALRIIREEEPRSLSAADRGLRGDLEVIVSTALVREPDRRYASAAELAADLRRFCRNEPIQARPASAIYQLRKLARRRQPAFIGLAIALAAIVLGGIASALLAVEMNRQRAHAERALDDSRQVSSFLLDLFLGSPDEPQVDRIELLRRAERRLRDAPPQDLATRAKLHEYIGHGYLKLWSQEEAASHLAEALALRESLGELDADFVKATHLLAMQRIAAGRASEAEDLLRLALQRRRQLWGDEHLADHPDPELLWFITRYTPDEPEVAADATRRAARRAWAANPGEPPAPPADLPLVVREDFDASAPAGWETELHSAAGWTTDSADGRLLVSGIDVETDPGQGIIRLARRLPQPLADYWLQARVGWHCDDVTAIQTLTFGLFPDGRQHSCYVGFTDGWVQATGAFAAYIATDRSFFTKATGGGDTAPRTGEAVFTIARTGDDVTIWWNDEVVLRGACSAPATELFINFVASRGQHLGGTATFGRLWIDDLELRGRTAP